MTTATLTLEAETTDATTFCDCCDEEHGSLTPSPLYDGQMVCPSCHAEHVAEVEAEALAAAEEAREEAIADAQGDLEEAESDLEGLMDEMKELRERIAEAKRMVRAAKTRLAKLEEKK